MDRKIAVIVMLFLILANPVYGITYSFEVQQNGETDVVIDADKKTALTLPKDADIRQGSYSLLGEQIEFQGGLEYASSYYTRKQSGIWYFEADITADEVQLTLPEDVKVIKSEPKSKITRGDGISLQWEDISGGVNVSYVIPREYKSISNKQEFPLLYPLLLGIIVFAGGLFLIFKKKSRPGKIDITEGQMNIMRAVNENDSVVLKLMIKHNGHMKRNILEKESGLSKSSLASSLHNLEHKKIIEIDRSFHVHYVKLSDWFKGL